MAEASGLRMYSNGPGRVPQSSGAANDVSREVMDVLREFHRAVGPMIFEHDGTIAQFTGDGMLVFFNDPVQLDDPAWQAVRLSVAMSDRTAELSALWKRCGHELELGIGIAVGFATCGEIGFEGRTEYTAIGTVEITALR